MLLTAVVLYTQAQVRPAWGAVPGDHQAPNGHHVPSEHQASEKHQAPIEHQPRDGSRTPPDEQAGGRRSSRPPSGRQALSTTTPAAAAAAAAVKQQQQADKGVGGGRPWSCPSGQLHKGEQQQLQQQQQKELDSAIAGSHSQLDSGLDDGVLVAPVHQVGGCTFDIEIKNR